ncbi:MAG: AI-2E family transporter, partial [Stellaceae bacterium]
FGTILAVVLLIYFLVSGKRIANGVFWLIPPEYRREVDAIAAKILPMLWRYFVGLMAVVVYTTSVAWIGFGAIFHLQHAALLAIAIGLLELIPVIGPAVSIGLIGLTAIQQTSLLGVAGLAILAIALRISIDQIVGPLLLGRAARVHPVVIIFAFLSGAVLFGVVGLLLAVPFAASINIVLTVYYAEPIRGDNKQSDQADSGSPPEHRRA